MASRVTRRYKCCGGGIRNIGNIGNIGSIGNFVNMSSKPSVCSAARLFVIRWVLIARNWHSSEFAIGTCFIGGITIRLHVAPAIPANRPARHSDARRSQPSSTPLMEGTGCDRNGPFRIPRYQSRRATNPPTTTSPLVEFDRWNAPPISVGAGFPLPPAATGPK